eukprot:NODE_1669_length_794_cov_132.315436_g1393_i0.p1 GENE.NODE_1669_length_794_cov_132.315436_g1393_i0~~NODE_1669_length_794_cov_132.315436_g1393_i0.p1  ORF type:complete len:193 (-),score=31.01 NODE_1669_length_794_cov_132.315436_g1393_i0:183-761(-)
MGTTSPTTHNQNREGPPRMTMEASEFTEDQVALLEAIFQNFLDGCDRRDLQYALSKTLRVGFQLFPSNGQLRDIVSALHEPRPVDPDYPEDRDRPWDLPAFLDLVASHCPPKGSNPTQVLIEAFQMFDRDSSGFLSAHELKVILSRMGEPLPQAEADKMIAEADTNGDGMLDYQEYARYMTKGLYNDETGEE